MEKENIGDWKVWQQKVQDILHFKLNKTYNGFITEYLPTEIVQIQQLIEVLRRVWAEEQRNDIEWRMGQYFKSLDNLPERADLVKEIFKIIKD